MGGRRRIWIIWRRWNCRRGPNAVRSPPFRFLFVFFDVLGVDRRKTPKKSRRNIGKRRLKERRKCWGTITGREEGTGDGNRRGKGRRGRDE